MRKIVLSVMVLISASLSLQAADSSSIHLISSTESKLWLSGTSTLHPYGSTSTLTQISAEVSADAVDATDVARRGPLTHFDLIIPVKGLKSGESGLDKNLYKALKEEQSPEIHFHLIQYKAMTVLEDGALSFQATGALSIAGAQKDIVLTGTAKPAADYLLLDGEYKLLMSDYGVKPPTLMFGAIKVGDPVVVHFHLKFVIKKGEMQ